MVLFKSLGAGRIVFGFLVFVFVLSSAPSVLASTIGGFVYDKQRNPLYNVDVELLNENRSVLNRAKTDPTGRYSFTGVPDGRHYVRVLPFRYSYQDQTQEVVVNTLSLLGTGNGYFGLDFYLVPKKGGLGETITGVIFAQEIPKAAEDLYKQALDDLANKQTEAGMKKLLEAIKIFPKYYAASQMLGMRLIVTKQYLEAAQLFIRAAEINPKSSKAFYYMGFSLHKLGKKYNKAALQALKKAAILAPASFEVSFLRGKVERQQQNFVEAEKQLLRAKKQAEARIPEIHIELAQLYGNDLKQYAKAADELEAYMKASDKKKDKKLKKQIADLRTKAKKG